MMSDQTENNVAGSPPSSSNKTKYLYLARIEEFKELLQTDLVSEDRLRRLAFTGIPEESNLRPKFWRLLLNYLPLNTAEWDSFLKKKRALYNELRHEMLSTEREKDPGSPGEADHPLNDHPDSNWQVFFKDNEVLLQIDKDVRRLCPDMNFFQSPTRFPCEAIVNRTKERLHSRVTCQTLNASNVVRKGLGVTKISNENKEILQPLENSEAHWEVVERILFIYAKLNPGQSYVQGMNEIIGPIYYTLATDTDADWVQHAEADTFHLFTNLMAEIRDFFIRSLDNSSSGIQSMIERLMERLKKRDPVVHERLVQQQIHPQYFCFRWLTLLLSQEFDLPDVIRIWDSLFSDKRRFNFLIDVCVAMVIHVRANLLEGDFASNMKLLQNFPSVDVRVILHFTKDLEDK